QRGERVEEEQSLGEAHAFLAPVALQLALVTVERVALDRAGGLELGHAALQTFPQLSVHPFRAAEETKTELPARVRIAHEEQRIEIGVGAELTRQRQELIEQKGVDALPRQIRNGVQTSFGAHGSNE